MLLLPLMGLVLMVIEKVVSAMVIPIPSHTHVLYHSHSVVLSLANPRIRRPLSIKSQWRAWRASSLALDSRQQYWTDLPNPSGRLMPRSKIELWRVRTLQKNLVVNWLAPKDSFSCIFGIGDDALCQAVCLGASSTAWQLDICEACWNSNLVSCSKWKCT